ncbi:MAG: hypothetical protein EOO92_12415 [Pedobacter sp.]|nr:MAG: hypothetical protein EOO92_12415 [Pedobacter sp.]
MIKLTYFPNGADEDIYQVVRFRKDEPWRIIDGDELLASIEKRNGEWLLRGKADVPEDLIAGVGRLIDEQEFNKIPLQIKNRWFEEVKDVVMQDDRNYLVICQENIDFCRFEKMFRGYLQFLIKDEWQIVFKVYDAEMNSDFELTLS